MVPPLLQHHTSLPSVFTLSVSVRSVHISITALPSGPMGTGICWEGRVGVSGSSRATVLVKSLQGHHHGGITSPTSRPARWHCCTPSSPPPCPAPRSLAPSLPIPCNPPWPYCFLVLRGQASLGLIKWYQVLAREKRSLLNLTSSKLRPRNPAGTPSLISSLRKGTAVYAEL